MLLSLHLCPRGSSGADGHAGADLAAYKAYLPRRLHDDFDAWAVTYENPFHDLDRPDRVKNWDSTLRARELADDGHGRGGEISSGETGAGGDAGERGARARGKLESAALLRGHENSFGRHPCRRAFEV